MTTTQVAFDGPDGLCTVQTTAPGVHSEAAAGRPRFSHVIAGGATVTDASGISRELTAGSAITLPLRWSGSWHVGTPLRTFDVFSTWPLRASHE
ncbi:MAG: hypothetical protein ACRDOK_16150, partial [Streptosporangiaceae bacterium]